MDEKLKQFLFLMLSAAFALLLVWGLNLFGIRSYSPTVLLLMLAPVLLGYLFLEHGHVQKIAVIYLYPAYAIAVILGWLASSVALGVQLFGASISTLFSLMLLVPLLSRLLREQFVKDRGLEAG